MALEKVTKFVIPFSEIEGIVPKNHWILAYPQHSFVESHIDEEDDSDPISEWIEERYPELVDEISFFIHIE